METEKNHRMPHSRNGIYCLLVVALAVVFLLPIIVKAEEKVDSFQSDIVVASDSTFTVTETIVYNFGDLERHGIYRTIPYHYTRNGSNYNIRITILSVVDENGSAWQYTTSRSLGKLTIKIGDPAAYMSGIKTFVISYQVKRAINYFNDHDELYFNVTGNEWEVPIVKTTATVELQKAVSAEQWQLSCFIGVLGSRAEGCITETSPDGSQATFDVQATLGAQEGLTIVAGWPAGTLQQPSMSQKIQWFVSDNWPIALPLIMLVFMFFIWFTRGRDPKGRGTIIPIYEAPANMPAGELGTVVDERVDLKDISATIIQLAAKGYLKIKEIKTEKLIGSKRDYELIKLHSADTGLRDFEQKVFNGIFDTAETRTVSDLKDKFYVHLKPIKASMYSLVVTDGYFPTDPDKVRRNYGVIASIITVVSMIMLFGTANVTAGIGVLITGIIAMIFSRTMPRKTKHGAEIMEEILGFKLFMSVTQTERIKFHNAPAKSPQQFEVLLPYAMVLGVEREWAKQFESIYLTPPEWYEGSHGTAFGAWYLANSLGSFSSSMGHAMVAAPSRSGSAGFGSSGFGGGGFSGGGFGGGGGGSW